MDATLNLRDWGGDATSGRHALDARAAYHGWRNDDHSLTAPGAATSVWGIAQVLDKAARHCDFLQLPLGEEADVPATGRPEWILGLFRSRQRLGIGSIERAEPEALRSIHSGGED